SEFIFTAGNRIVASSLPPGAVQSCTASLLKNPQTASTRRISAGNTDYLGLRRPLLDIAGQPLGQLWILRSFETEQRALSDLRRDLGLLWGGALLAALALAWVVAQQLMRPIARLDAAAAEVSRQNYAYRVPV